MRVIQFIVYFLLAPLQIYSNDVVGDAELLARLLVAEVDVMEPSVRDDAALGILSTVFYHLETGGLGDTIYEILSAPAPNGYWAFPPEVTVPCDVLLDQRRCLEGRDMTWAYQVLAEYVSGERGTCHGYAAYHAMDCQPSQCVVSDGRWEAHFHDSWGWQTDMMDVLGLIGDRIY